MNIDLKYKSNSYNFHLRKDTSIKYIAASGIMAFVIYLIGNWLGPRVLTNILQAVVGLTVYLICLIIMNDTVVQKVLQRIKERVSHV